MNTIAAGCGEALLTPPLGVELTGYGFYLNRRAESVLDDLKVRALCVESGGTRHVLISCDLIGLTIEASDSIRIAAARSLGIPPLNILLACTHTHSGPATMSLPGLGTVDPEYTAGIAAQIIAAAEAAAADIQEARFSHSRETLEPLGYNRRRGSFEDIDSLLGLAYFRRRHDRIIMLTYACHPVVLGRNTAVSADWPGAAVRALETAGDRALVFQGFCGDIDPVTNMNRWGAGTPADLELYGRILSDRARKSEAFAVTPPDVRIAAKESRVRLPLSVPEPEGIERDAAVFLEKNGSFPGAGRFIEKWRQAAAVARERLAGSPFLEDVPIQVFDWAGLKILGLPGEAFCAYAHILGFAHPGLFPVGYANGDVGYFPTREAYADTGDYAAYAAPKFYALFPFRSDIGEILLQAGRDVLEDGMRSSGKSNGLKG
jgi:hypothetical protein